MNAMTKHPPAPPADPIDAAVKKYAAEMVLPELTAACPDDLLIAHIHRGGELIVRTAETRARQAYDHAASRQGAPVATLDKRLAETAAQIRALRQGNTAPGTRKAADWACQVAVLRVCLDAMSYFAAFADRWGKMSEDQRQQERAQAERNATARSYAIGTAGMAPAAFSPSAFLTTLTARGITVTPGTGDALLVTSAKLLTQAERSVLTAQKATILAAFGTETF